MTYFETHLLIEQLNQVRQVLLAKQRTIYECVRVPHREPAAASPQFTKTVDVVQAFSDIHLGRMLNTQEGNLQFLES